MIGTAIQQHEYKSNEKKKIEIYQTRARKKCDCITNLPDSAFRLDVLPIETEVDEPN